MPVAHRVRTLREDRGLSLRALADAAGISPATLSQILQGQTSPSVATLEKLAHGLRIPMAAFFGEVAEGNVELLSPELLPTFALGRGAVVTPLAAQVHASGFEPVLIRLNPAGQLDEQPFLVGIESEFVWIRRGAAVLHYDGQEIDVRETQAVYYDPRRPHNWRNPHAKACELLMVRQR